MCTLTSQATKERASPYTVAYQEHQQQQQQQQQHQKQHKNENQAV